MINSSSWITIHSYFSFLISDPKLNRSPRKISPDDQTKAILKWRLRYDYELYYFIKQRLYSHLCLLQKAKPKQTSKFNYTNYFGHKKKIGSLIRQSVIHEKDSINSASQSAEQVHVDEQNENVEKDITNNGNPLNLVDNSNQSNQNNQAAENETARDIVDRTNETDNGSNRIEEGYQEDSANDATPQ